CVNTSGGSGTKTYSIISGALPTGVTLSGTNNCFQGQVKSTGQDHFRARVNDQTSNNPQTAEQNYTIKVYAADQSTFGNSAPLSFGAGTGRRLAESVITGITGSVRATPLN